MDFDILLFGSGKKGWMDTVEGAQSQGNLERFGIGMISSAEMEATEEVEYQAFSESGRSGDFGIARSEAFEDVAVEAGDHDAPGHVVVHI